MFRGETTKKASEGTLAYLFLLFMSGLREYD